MTTKTATVRVYVAFAALLVAILHLLSVAVRLVASIAAWAAAAMEARTDPRRVALEQLKKEVELESNVAAPRTSMRRVRSVVVDVEADAVPSPAPAEAMSSQAERLRAALTGLGFHAPDVRQFVRSLGPRVETEGLEGLIKEGLRTLAS